MADGSSLSLEIQHLRFLVAESNPALQKSIVNTLGKAGVQASHGVPGGAEALQHWKEEGGVGVIICSWNLPGLAGIDLLKRVRAEKQARLQPAFIMMASDEAPEILAAAVAEGADCFVVKPFPMGNLLSLVSEGVEHRKQLAGPEVFTESILETRQLESAVQAQLIHDRHGEAVECDDLSGTRCSVLTHRNFGLGTNLDLRFARPGSDPPEYHQLLKGIVTKMERVSGQAGMYRVHIQFNGPAKEEHGVKELLLSGGGA